MFMGRRWINGFYRKIFVNEVFVDKPQLNNFVRILYYNYLIEDVNSWDE